MFGSIITIGAMIGAITSGRIADFIGRKGVLCEFTTLQIDLLIISFNFDPSSL